MAAYVAALFKYHGMKKIIITLLLPLLAIAASAQAIDILSLNNSLIDYNNQPAMFNAMAAAMGKDARWQARTQLGRTLIFHFNDPLSHDMAMSRPWHFIILQEQSALPRTAEEAFAQSVLLWKKALLDKYPESTPTIILPMNWAYSDADDIKAQTAKLKRSYLNAARDIPGVVVSPVGLAYEMIYNRDEADAFAELYTDNRHPTLAATYLAACLEYAVIFGESPEKITFVPEGLDGKKAAHMRRIAADTLADWTTYSSTSR